MSLAIGAAYRPMRHSLTMAMARAWKIETVLHAAGEAKTWRYVAWRHNVAVIEEDGSRIAYDAKGLVKPSSTRTKAGFGENSSQLTVFLGTGTSPITADHVASGILDGARVTRYCFDPFRPWLEPFRVHRFFVADVQEGRHSAVLDLVGISSKLRHASGIDLGPTCRNDFLGRVCDWNSALSSNPDFGFLTYQAGAPLEGNSRRTFRMREAADSFPSAADDDADWWAHGLVTFHGGRNRGVTAVIESNTKPVDNGFGLLVTDVVLATPLAFPVEEGVALKARVGCDRARSTCKVKFGNLDNHRGHEMPGTDTLRISGGAE